MDTLLEEFNKLIENKNKEIEEKFLLKTKKMKDVISSDDITPVSIDTIDYNTKKTISKINAEKERKYKASKAYKNSNTYIT